MKRMLALILAMTLLLTTIPVLAEESGIWEERQYVDEFELPTGDTYVSNKYPIVGKFSNSATTDSSLEVYLFYDEGQINDFLDIGSVWLRLIEYGSYIVKNSYSKSQEYTVSLMDPQGVKYSLTGIMYSGSDRLTFNVEDSETIIKALCQDGLVRFAIQDQNSKYLFNIADSTGFVDFVPVAPSIDSFDYFIPYFGEVLGDFYNPLRLNTPNLGLMAIYRQDHYAIGTCEFMNEPNTFYSLIANEKDDVFVRLQVTFNNRTDAFYMNLKKELADSYGVETYSKATASISDLPFEKGNHINHKQWAEGFIDPETTSYTYYLWYEDYVQWEVMMDSGDMLLITLSTNGKGRELWNNSTVGTEISLFYEYYPSSILR